MENKEYKKPLHIFNINENLYCVLTETKDNSILTYTRRIYRVDNSTYRFRYKNKWYLVNIKMLCRNCLEEAKIKEYLKKQKGNTIL